MGQVEQSQIYELGNGEFVPLAISMNVASMRRWTGFGPVKKVVDQFAIDLVEGRVMSCPHLRSPRTVFVGMASPHRMYCRPCSLTELFPRLNEVADASECDACGESTPALHETTLNVGSVILFGNICVACNEASLTQWAS